MSFDEAIAYSKDLANWIGERIDNAELKWVPKIHLAAACFQVGLSHHSATIALLEQRRFVSALALLRPAMECFLRGVWINRAASDLQLDAFVRGGRLSIDDVIRDIEQAAVFDDGRIRDIRREVWSDLCDFAHCGGKTITSHFRDDELVPNFSEEYLLRALTSANAWALMTALWVAILSENMPLAEEMLARSKTLGPVLDHSY